MSQEHSVHVAPGWGMLTIALAALVGGGLLFVDWRPWLESGCCGLLGILSIIAAIVMFAGFITLQPNEAAVLLLFGAYQGTLRESGFYWANPFFTKKKISLRLRNMEGQKLKVNDKQGNPIEIATVIVWRVQDTAQATFDVDNYAQYVNIQSETAVRHLANSYAYDHGEENELTLRSGGRRGFGHAQGRIGGPAGQGGSRRRGGPAHAPGLRAGDCRRHASPPAGRCDHRRPAEDRARRGVDGPNGAQGSVRAAGGRVRSGSQGGDGQQSAGGAVRRTRDPAGDQHGQPADVT